MVKEIWKYCTITNPTKTEKIDLTPFLKAVNDGNFPLAQEFKTSIFVIF